MTTVSVCLSSRKSDQVGFGDIVPTNREFYLLDLCYIIIGLAITWVSAVSLL